MATVPADIEVVLRVPGTVTYDEQGYMEYLDGSDPDNESLFAYIQSDPDWMEGSVFPAASSDAHEVIEAELVSVNDNNRPDRTSPVSSTGSDQ